RAHLAAEFPREALDFSDGVSRRGFMTLMGAAVALGTLEGCRRPVDNILPYARMPEDVAVNVTSYYATVLDRRGESLGLLVESHEGRPTKVEGNPDHRASLGKTDLLTQASVLDLYDPDRARQPSTRGEDKRYADAEAALRGVLEAQAANGGGGLRVLAQPSSSPTFVRLRQAVLRRFPNARFHSWSAASNSNVREGARLAFGQVVLPVLALETARVIVSLDSDFLQTETGSVRNTRGFAQGRRPGPEMSRLYVVEPSYTTTGANADHRLRLPAREVELYLHALAGRLVSQHNLDLGEIGNAVRNAQAPQGVPAKWIEAVANDLAAHRGASVLVAGSRQPAAVHALTHAINQALGNAGQTVTYVAPADRDEAEHGADIAALAEAMGNGQVQALVILGANPVYDAPGDLAFGDKLARVPNSFLLSSHRDETAARATWHIPRAHELEAWGDGQSLDGTVAIQQPLIQPLFGGRSELELLAFIADMPSTRGHDLVQETHRAAGVPAVIFNRAWRRALNRGVHVEAAAGATVPSILGAAIAQRLGQRPAGSPIGQNNLEVNFLVDNKMLDGRHANNAWLLELPDPITKITWDNAAYVSPATAAALGINNGDMIRLSKGNKAVEVVAWTLPGQADWSIGLTLGWGRTRAGRVGTGKGFDVTPLRAANALWFTDGVAVAKTGATYPLSQTQDHFRMEGRPMAVEATLAEFNETPNFAARRSPTPRTLPLWREVDYSTGYRWGMTIDLASCTGCNTCVVACQSENNIPVVGKEQVSRGREMHWLRIDRYFVSPKAHGRDADPEATSDPMVAHQPLMCVHCEEAPCENVCPVNATVHSPEGLNEMAYNRCIGTRYCANNCPYKVRRFNYLNWHNDGVYQPEDADVPETVRMQMNPNVTVRFRGVMEKCTYCVQRIQGRKIEARRSDNGHGRHIRDGELMSACQQACPADAIVFGDLNDQSSRIAQLHRNDRRYALLGEIGTKPRTLYLAKIRNPNPEMLG
ncbi:MAG: Molybdopterin oxidoreductase, iron-sulfur binding subunit, partial [Rhizobium sp.]|nr:Molybdopterin oxidoreductase, iron-sulfur binding subunit [Rhizobium sp.]